MKIFINVIAIFLFLLFPFSAFAAIQLSASEIPLTIDQSNDFDVSVSLLCSGCTSDSYLRGVFYSTGNNYFGYTKDNNGNWINATGGDCTSYLRISPSDLSKEGTWSGKLKVKPDIKNAFYNGPGEYLFKVGRYTPSCGSPAWSSETTIVITGPTSTPTPAPTSIPQNPTNSPTPIKSGPTPTITKTSTPTKILFPTGRITSSIIPSRTKFQDVLGEQAASISAEPTRKQQKVRVLAANENRISQILIGIGFVFLITCGIVAGVQKFRKDKLINE